MISNYRDRHVGNQLTFLVLLFCRVLETVCFVVLLVIPQHRVNAHSCFSRLEFNPSFLWLPEMGGDFWRS